MPEVVDWLKTLGMSEYAQRFAENDVDISVLPHLSDHDLKELGVSLGHRRKMLAAIAKLDETSAAAAPVPAPRSQAPVPSTVPPVPEAAGERRHVTVMFCDLVDSTGISARLDAEEWRDLVGAYLDAASAAVTEMGGKVAKKLGDGLMALFGYRVAQENDAERAVRAALAIKRSLAELNRENEGSDNPALAARIAIDSGPVVIDAAGENFRRRAEYRGAGTGVSRGGFGRGYGAGAAADRRSVRSRGARQPRTQRRARASDAVPHHPGEWRRTPRRAAPSHAPRRPRGGTRAARPALGAGAARRRAVGPDRRRARVGQNLG